MLARRPPEIAGQQIGLSAQAARAYAAVFVDVADRLDDVGFMAQTLCGAFGRPEPRLGYVLRSCALAGGPIVLDDLLHAFGLSHLALRPPYQGDDAALHDLGRRATIALHLVPPKNAAAQFMIKLGLRYERLDRLTNDPHRHEVELRKLLRAQVSGARRLFGVAVRDNPFLAMLFAPG
jgi:hypothetical protein